MADEVEPVYVRLLRLLGSCEEVEEGYLLDKQYQGATYKTLAAIGHTVGMSGAERADWYKVAESIPLSTLCRTHPREAQGGEVMTFESDHLCRMEEAVALTEELLPPSASNLTADEATFLYTIITPRRRRVKLQFTVEKVGYIPHPDTTLAPPRVPTRCTLRVLTRSDLLTSQ
jgi:hypothetical protein